MATLTGAAHIALGPELPAFYCNDSVWAQQISQSAHSVYDPLWQMPLWKPYEEMLSSPIADLNNITGNNFAGSIVAALFLNSFVEKLNILRILIFMDGFQKKNQAFLLAVQHKLSVLFITSLKIKLDAKCPQRWIILELQERLPITLNLLCASFEDKIV